MLISVRSKVFQPKQHIRNINFSSSKNILYTDWLKAAQFYRNYQLFLITNCGSRSNSSVTTRGSLENRTINFIIKNFALFNLNGKENEFLLTPFLASATKAGIKLQGPLTNLKSKTTTVFGP